MAGLAAFSGYWSQGVTLHFFLHLFIGSIAGLSILIVVSRFKPGVVEYEYLFPFLGWLFAATPELFVVSDRHPTWTDIFLGHVSADEIMENSPMILIYLSIVVVALLAAYVKLRPKNQ